MNEAILYIDGENLRHYIENVLKKEGISKNKANILKIDLKTLFDKTLKRIKISRRIYYASRIRFHKNTPRKSRNLIQKQRILKTRLEKAGFEFVVSGNIRAQTLKVNKKSKVVFREKGVDVKIAVDLVTAACDKKAKTAIICSSDSDLQPAVQEARARGTEIIYLGFEINPNKGLIYTTNRAVLIRNSEILDCFQK
ncbi:MAG: NYN domain-containing protein [Candidatus Shapirobacteria bacterium]